MLVPDALLGSLGFVLLILGAAYIAGKITSINLNGDLAKLSLA